MGERTSHAPGTFSWTDLATDDPAAAKEFYGSLFGWQLEDNPVPDAPPYTMAKIDGRAVAAMYQRGPDQPHSFWLSYVTVDDADAIAARATELGGSVLQEPFDVMEFGRMSVLQDPTAAAFAVWQPGTSIGAELVNDIGAMCINQLNTSDPEAAQSFYAGLFGWRAVKVNGGAMPFWSLYNGDRLNGGMAPLPPGGDAPPHWLVYFTTADLDANVEQIGTLGGRVLVPPISIPAGRIAVAADAQGAVFALFEGDVEP